MELIANASFVVTNSFHCAVFAILFRKKFVVFDNPSGGTDRIRTLLASLHLSDRFLSLMSGFDTLRERLDMPVDFEAVEAHIRECRKESLAFLKEI